MAEDRAASNSEAGASVPSGQGNSQWASILQDLGRRLLPVVVSTGSLLTFVAFAGSVIVWTRLNAVEVAPDQAITAFPRGELVSIGASLLLLYGFFGALAVLGAFLIDRGGRPTQGMAYGLLFLLVAEGVGTITMATEFGSWDWATAMVLFLFPVGVAAWTMGLGWFSELRDELHRRRLETLRPLRGWTELRPKPTYLLSKKSRRKRRKKGWKATPSAVLCSGLWVVLGAIAAGMAVLLPESVPGHTRFIVAAPFPALFAVTVAYALWSNWLATRKFHEDLRRAEAEENDRLAVEEELEARLGPRARRQQSGEQPGHRGVALENSRLAKRRPYRLHLTWPGIAVVVPSLLLAAGLPAWQLGESWLGAALAAAAVICMLLWRVAVFTRDRIIWFGLAVFLSVPLFGTFTQMARNLDDPQIQPVALIRSTDRPDEAIHGLYVTEAKERVYFASAATEGCTGTLRENSGRLLWVPKDEVVAMSIGPLQSVGDAAKSSLEMAFALTPAVETPAGDSVSLTPGEARSEEGDLGEEAPLTVQRLENVGPAVRPTFGRGLGLDPEGAGPEDVVTLTMSTPIEDGFGTHRDGRSLRVGGTPAEIAINPVRDGERAEFVATEAGPPLPLDKGLGVYVETEDGEFVRDDDAPADEDEDRFVKLVEGTRVASTDHSDEDGRLYLRIEEEDGADTIAQFDPTGALRDGTTAVLAPTLHRQAWNKDEIKFKVPEKAGTGAVTVDCEQLAGEPLLRVERPPEAELAVRLTGAGRSLELDSRRSHDDGRIRARRWAHNGLPLAPAAGEAKRRVGIPLRGSHRLRLAVEDEQGEVGRASLYVLRVPDARALRGGQGKRHRERLHAVLARLAGADGGPVEVLVNGHGGGPGGGGADSSSLRAARTTFQRLMTPEVAGEAGLDGEGAKVRVRGFVGRCGVVPRGTDRRHVDFLIAAEGVRLLPRRGCAPAEREEDRWSSGEALSEGGGDLERSLLRLLESLARQLRG